MASSTVKRSLRRWPFCSCVCSCVGLFLSCVSAGDLFSFDALFLWRSYKNTNDGVRLLVLFMS